MGIEEIVDFLLPLWAKPQVARALLAVNDFPVKAIVETHLGIRVTSAQLNNHSDKGLRIGVELNAGSILTAGAVELDELGLSFAEEHAPDKNSVRLVRKDLSI